MKGKKEVIKMKINTKVTFIPEVFATAHDLAMQAGWKDWKYIMSNAKTMIIEKIK